MLPLLEVAGGREFAAENVNKLFFDSSPLLSYNISPLLKKIK
jgi:hypothetical protein